MFLSCLFRRFLAWLIVAVAIGILCGDEIEALGWASASEVAPPPSPQPATPPQMPNFDQEDDDGLSAQAPLPATPPHPSVVPQPKVAEWPPITNEPAYDGIEYRFKRFVFRPAQYSRDGALLAILLLYAYLSYLGKRSNRQKVNSYWQAMLSRLSREFAHLGTDPAHGEAYAQIGPASYVAYASGRLQSCHSLRLIFNLRSRQDLPMRIYEWLRSSVDFNWSGNVDRVEWVWQMSGKGGGKVEDKSGAFEAKDLLVWALVKKSAMEDLRRDRWDVRTFTEVKEASVLPSDTVVMSESGEVTDQVLKSKELGLIDALKSHPESFKWFDSLVISGTLNTEPTETQLPTISIPKTRTITLKLRLPPTSQAAEQLGLIDFCFKMLDLLDHPSSTSNPMAINILSAQKLAKRRNEWAQGILADAKREAEREKEEERRKKMKEIQDQKLTKMSASEQKKFDEKERRRKAMKMSKTAMKRK